VPPNTPHAGGKETEIAITYVVEKKGTGQQATRSTKDIRTD
jgi:hypothetical protein